MNGTLVELRKNELVLVNELNFKTKGTFVGVSPTERK